MAYDSYSKVDVRDGYQVNDVVDGDAKDVEIEVNQMRKATDVLTVIVEQNNEQRARYARPFILARFVDIFISLLVLITFKFLSVFIFQITVKTNASFLMS